MGDVTCRINSAINCISSINRGRDPENWDLPGVVDDLHDVRAAHEELQEHVAELEREVAQLREQLKDARRLERERCMDYLNEQSKGYKHLADAARRGSNPAHNTDSAMHSYVANALLEHVVEIRALPDEEQP